LTIRHDCVREWLRRGWVVLLLASERGISEPGSDEMLRQGYNGARPDHGQGKVTVTAAARNKTTLQAGMCKGISGVRGSVGLQGEQGRQLAGSAWRESWKSEKRPWQPGMSKARKNVAGYVAGRGRGNWDL
jgi:hypothetical protein